MDVLLWDGTHIGDITNDVEFKPGKDDKKQGVLASYKDTIILVLQYKNKFPLIVDELKSVFGLTQMFYHQATINNTEYIISRQWDCDTTLHDYDANENHYPETPFFLLELRRIFVFRAVFFLSFNNDNSVYVKPLGETLYNKVLGKNTALPISRIESNYSLLKQTMQPMNSEHPSEIIRSWKRQGDVPKKIITKYFNNDEEMFQNEVDKFRSEISAIDIKYKMLALIKKYEPDTYIDWVNAVFLHWKA
jgi:hypothetical protein